MSAPAAGKGERGRDVRGVGVMGVSNGERLNVEGNANGGGSEGATMVVGLGAWHPANPLTRVELAMERLLLF